MSPVLMVTAYLIQAYVLYVEVKKRWILGALTAGYFIACMLVFDFVVIFDLQNADFRINYTSFSALPMVGIARFSAETRSTFVALSILTLIAGLGGPPHAKSANPHLVSDVAHASQMFLAKNRVAIVSGLIFANVLNVIHFFSMDIGLLWLNSTYLAIKTADEIGITNPLMAIYHEILRILVLPAILGYFALSRTSQPFSKFLCLIYCFYGYIIMLAGSSRWIALYGVFAILAMQAFGKLTRPRLIVATIITFVAFEYAIYSRSLNYFGLSRVLPNLTQLNIGFAVDSLKGILVNSFEGALNFANGMIIAPHYSQTDQLYSISPFPNFIDGYDRLSGVLINTQAPMGGLGEMMFFSPFIQLIIVTFFLAVLRLAYVADRRANAFVRYVVTMAATYAVFILPSYSLRTSWKVLVLTAFGLIAWRLLHRTASTLPPMQSPDRVDRARMPTRVAD